MRLIDADAFKELLIDRRDFLTGVYGDIGGALNGVIKLLELQPEIVSCPSVFSASTSPAIITKEISHDET